MAVSVRQVAGNHGGLNTQSVSLGAHTLATPASVVCVCAAINSPIHDNPDPYVEDNGLGSWTLVESRKQNGLGDTLYVAIFVRSRGSGADFDSVTVTDSLVQGYRWGIVAYELEGVASGTYYSNTSDGVGSSGVPSSGTVTHNGSNDAALIGIGVTTGGTTTVWSPSGSAVTGYEVEIPSGAGFPGFNSAYNLSFSASSALEWASISTEWAAAAVGIQQSTGSSPSLVPNLFPRIPRTSLTR